MSQTGPGLDKSSGLTAAKQPSRVAAFGVDPSIWPLMAGIALLMVGCGLQGTLLGVRASIEGYTSEFIGIIMSGYYLGFMLGAIWTPAAVGRVGHIRVFAALTSLASITILVQATVVEPTTWVIMRIATGFCFAGIFVIAESWLNSAATNANRGQVLSIYMVVTYAGMAGGQFFMNVADPSNAVLFMGVSVVISVAAVPMLLNARVAPAIGEPQAINLLRLYRVSPLGTIGTFMAGLINGSIFGMGAVFAQRINMDVMAISIFMTAIILGTVVMQWPIGRLSDIFDRRRTITGVALLATICALGAWVVMPFGEVSLLLAMALFGGFGLTIHALCIAYVNDYLEPTEMVGASSGLVLILAAGSIAGPVVVGFLIGAFGPASFLLWLAAVSGFVLITALWRMLRRPALPQEEQGPFVPVATQASTVALEVAEEIHADEVATSN